MLTQEISWKEPKKRLSKSDVTKRAIELSKCGVSIELDGKLLRRVSITFLGELSAIPSLKNWRLPGKTFGNPAVIGRIAAMDELFMRALPADGVLHPWFGEQRVHALIICARRAGPFDLVGVVETVQDWLEPKSKKVGRVQHQRGWGIGLVDNDSQVTPTPRHYWQTGTPPELTQIIIEPWEIFQAHDYEFTSTILDEVCSMEVEDL